MRAPIRLLALRATAAATALAAAAPLFAHHSFAMYDRSRVYVLTGVVANLNPDPSHLQIVFVPLNGFARAGYALDNMFFPLRSFFSFIFLGDSVDTLKKAHGW